MALLFLGSGLALIFVGLRGDPAALLALVESDFSGPNNFVYWLAAMAILGALGYIESLKGLSRLFMVLVLIVLFLDNGGFFAQFQAYLNSTAGNSSIPVASNVTPQPNASGVTPAV